ncbi:hypothetical protein ACD591_16340 [Rufibacter glacialis]|uniref:Uncharacterized protein n=2 Tax=Rufibacter glacialis TaxID=1259555 RepID=A0ABV4RI98_9BACT|nr:hypothetical protein [Rufibacter glacialis]
MYTILIKQELPNLTGSELEQEVKEDTIMAINDTVAYQKALRAFQAEVITDENLDYKMGRSLGFRLQDSLGRDVIDALPRAVVDSLNTQAAAVEKRYREKEKAEKSPTI